MFRLKLFTIFYKYLFVFKFDQTVDRLIVVSQVKM